jgi:hypothetical protein
MRGGCLIQMAISDLLEEGAQSKDAVVLGRIAAREPVSAL